MAAASGDACPALGAIDAIYLWDWNAAEQNLRKDIALSPNRANAEVWFAIYLTIVNRPAEAVGSMRRALALAPPPSGLTAILVRRYTTRAAMMKLLQR